MKRLLLVSYFFPPDGGAGTQRAAKFCKYLPGAGWEPVVLARGGAALSKFAVPDPTLLADVPATTRVVRVEAPEPSSRSWIAAARAAAEELRARPVDAVLVTMSPFWLAGLGLALAADHGVPAVLDLRDPWALDGWRSYSTRLAWRRDLDAMERSLAAADGVVANTPESGRRIAELVPSLGAERLVVIPNGYDAEDLAGPEPARDPSRFRVVFAGSFLTEFLYPPARWSDRLRRLLSHRPEPIRPEGRTPKFLLEALRRLRAAGRPGADRVRVVLAGQGDAALDRCVAESGVAECVEVLGYLPHAQSVDLVRGADALFLPLHGLPPGHRSLIVPGKTYEYLASGVPVLGCLPPGDARELVAAAPGSAVADPCDADAVAAALAALLDDASGASRPRRPAPGVERFERRRLTTDLAAFLTRLTEPGGVARRGARPRQAAS